MSWLPVHEIVNPLGDRARRCPKVILPSILPQLHILHPLASLNPIEQLMGIIRHLEALDDILALLERLLRLRPPPNRKLFQRAITNKELGLHLRLRSRSRPSSPITQLLRHHIQDRPIIPIHRRANREKRIKPSRTGNQRPDGEDAAPRVSVQRLAGKLDIGEDGIVHPRPKNLVDELDKVLRARGDVFWRRNGRPEVNGSLRQAVDGVGERVADADDDAVGLRELDFVAPLEGFGGGHAEGVAV